MPDPLGRACIFPGVGQDAVTAVDVLVWRPADGGAEPRWLTHFINSPSVRAEIAAQAGGTTRQRVSGGRLKTLILPTPPIPEQRRIATKLDTLSARVKAARGELARIPLLIEHYKRAILEQAFTGKLTAIERLESNWKSVVFSTAGIDSRSSELLTELPIGWCWTSMDQVTHISGGLTKNSKRASIPTRVPYLRVANVYANELRLDDIKYIGCTNAEIEKTQLRPNDLLIVEGNGSIEQIGRVAVWDGSIAPCSHQNHLIRARPTSSIPSRYLLYWLVSPKGREAIERVASSSSGLHTLSITKVSGIPVPATCMVEARIVVDKVDAAFAWLDKLSANHAKSAQLLAHLEQGLLRKAFRGGLVPQDPNDEPAEKLLECIRAADKVEGRKRRSGRRQVAARRRS